MNDVSRETAVAQSATAVFGDRLPAAEKFVELLADAGVERGLIGPREVPRLWERHLLNCAVLSEIVEPDADVLDIGSGAGLPGIALSLARPDLWVTLVEPMSRRTEFLNEVIDELCLANVEVLRARAEEVEPRGQADIVTSRAVAPLGKLTSWCLPLAKVGGQVLSIKGASAPDEVAKYTKEIKKQGAGDVEVLRCGETVLDTPTTVIRMFRRQ